MDPSQIMAHMQDLLSKNIFLEDGTKQKLLALPPEVQVKAIEILEKLNEKQVSLFQKILKKDPNFFAKLEHVGSHKILMEIIEAEHADHVKEMIEAEQELEELLKKIK